METVSLLRCPFCGGEAGYGECFKQKPITYFVHCTECLCSTNQLSPCLGLPKEEAAAEWNRRAIPSAAESGETKAEVLEIPAFIRPAQDSIDIGFRALSGDGTDGVDWNKENCRCDHGSLEQPAFHCEYCAIHSALHAGRDAALALAAGRKDAWIKVSDRLPEDGVTVLVRGDSYDSSYQGGYVLARYSNYCEPPKWIIGKQECECYDMTHWQPLPAAPDSGQAPK